MSNFEQQIAFQHALLEISKELLSATPERIGGTIHQSLYEIGELVLASSISIQLFNDIEDQSDDDIISWSMIGEEVKPVPLDEALIEFFMKNDPFIPKGSIEVAFSDEPMTMDSLVYPMFVHNQPIGFVRFELMDVSSYQGIKKLLKHTVDIFTAAFERRFRNSMIFSQASVTQATLVAIETGIIATDDSGKIELINNYGETLLGLSSAVCVGKQLDEVVTIINETYDMAIESFIKDMILTQDYMPIEDPVSIVAGDVKKSVTLKMSPKYDSNQLYQGAVLIINEK